MKGRMREREVEKRGEKVRGWTLDSVLLEDCAHSVDLIGGQTTLKSTVREGVSDQTILILGL